MIYVFAVLLPPLALLWRGRVGAAALNLLLCFLFFLPGVIHACVVIARMDADRREARLLQRLGGAAPADTPHFGLGGILAVCVMLAGLGVVAWMAWAAWQAGLFFENAD